MTKYAIRNKSFFGVRQVKADGKDFSLDWGAHRVSISDGERKISVDNRVMAEKLGRMRLEDFVAREFRRVSA